MLLSPEDPGLIISESALKHLQQAVSAHQGAKPIGIRAHVKKAGCSGYEYDLNFAYPDSKTEHDFMFEKEGMVVLIDKEIYFKFFQGGTTLEFVSEGLNEGLQFKNPNVVAECGCGESFTLASDRKA